MFVYLFLRIRRNFYHFYIYSDLIFLFERTDLIFHLPIGEKENFNIKQSVWKYKQSLLANYFQMWRTFGDKI